MTELVVTTGAIRRAKLQSNRHHQQTNTQLFTYRMPLLSPNQYCQSTEWELSILHILVYKHFKIVYEIFSIMISQFLKRLPLS